MEVMEGDSEDLPQPPVIIRIRKGSDAPSLSEQKQGSAAPLASFEALSDLEESDTERCSSDAEDVFLANGGHSEAAYKRATSPSLAVPDNRPGLGHETVDQTPAAAEPSQCSDTQQKGNSDQQLVSPSQTSSTNMDSNNDGYEIIDTTPQTLQDDNYNTEESELIAINDQAAEADQDLDEEPCSVQDGQEYTRLDYEPPEISRTESDGQRPRSTTPINLTLQTYTEDSNGLGQVSYADNLGGEQEYGQELDLQNTLVDDAAWDEWTQDQLGSHSYTIGADLEGGGASEALKTAPGKRRAPPPPRPPPPRPPPPKTKQPPGKPLPPVPPVSKVKKTAVMKDNWEVFEGTIPALPCPPKKEEKKKPLDDSGISSTELLDDSIDGVNISSFDEETALFDPTSPTEKKPKSKGLSPKRLRGIVDSPKKAKSPRKEKQAKLKPESDKTKFVPYEENLDEKSEEWLKYQEMQDRIQSIVDKSQKKLMESDLEDDLAKLEATSAQNSPWATLYPSTTAANDSPQESKPDPKVGWVGFEDSFTNTTESVTTSAKSLPHLTVSPVPSPQHPPVPPFNSRQTSVEELSKAASNEAADNGIDLLGLSADKKSDEQKTTNISDLLGLDSIDSEQVQKEGSGLNVDILELSRNPLESNRSSTVSSPTPLQDPMALGTEASSAAEKSTKPSDTSMALVDEFLGIDPSAAEAKPLPTDPLDMLGYMKSQKESAQEAAKQQDTTDEFASASSAMDDFLGLSAGDNLPSTVTEIDGDLMKETETPSNKPTETASDTKPSDDPFVVHISIRNRAAPSSKMPTSVVGSTSFLPAPPTKAEVQLHNLASPLSDDFDPRSGLDDDEFAAMPVTDSGADALWGKSSENPFRSEADETQKDSELTETLTNSKNPFAGGTLSAENPFAQDICAVDVIPFADDFALGGVSEGVTATEDEAAGFNPFATILEGESVQPAGGFDPFQTIHDDDAFDAHFPSTEDDAAADEDIHAEGTTSPRVNPFDKEPPLPEKFANFEPDVKSEDPQKSPTVSSESSVEEEILEPLEPFYEKFEGEGWKLLLRQPMKKKLTQNRFWKPVYVRLVQQNNTASIKVYSDENSRESFHELALQPSYNLCDMGLQQFDQFGKCHTVKVQYVFYRERVGVKAERITPTLGDLARVRDLKGLKDLVHKPKTTMILDHAPQASELLKFGGLNYKEFRFFIHELEDALFRLEAHRDKTLSYTKDEITVDVVDDYYVELDTGGHITFHKARVRVFCLAFLTGMPKCEIGMNDKRRQGKEVVGRHDIIPIKTEEWIRIRDHELHSSINVDEFDKTKTIQFRPLDACQFEVMRFRVKPEINKELPLQIKMQMSLVERHLEIRGEVMIPGYYSNSKRAAQTPCEDIQIRIPMPEPWIYYFRVEKRFRYGSLKSTTRKPGKIKGLERLTMMAQGMLPASLIEVSTGTAKYEHVFSSVVWRIDRLPGRNEGAYKTHLFVLRLDLGPHDPIPDSFDRDVYVQYNMPNSTVSRAQVRSISVDSPDPPDKWVHHLAKYEYKVEMEFSDKPNDALTDMETSPVVAQSPVLEAEGVPEEEKELDSDTSDSD